MTPDTLHTHLRAVIEERLKVARAYLDACGGSHGWCGDECEEFQAQNDGADAVRRYTAALRVLERHAPDKYDLCVHCQERVSGDFSAEWPCDEVRDLAASLGVEVDT